MYELIGAERPWLRRVDHLICEVPDIGEAMNLFTERLGFPVAWPIGRFWPQGLTAGVAIGGLNLEFIQLDEGAHEAAQIRTLVFEPTNLDEAAEAYRAQGLDTELREKWEPDPHLLRLRGYSEEESRQPRLICRNLIPRAETPIDFFLCDYSPDLRRRLSPNAFPGMLQVSSIEIALPNPTQSWPTVDRLFGLPMSGRGCALIVREEPADVPEVVALHSDRGPLDFGGWPARFRFV